MMIVMQLNAEEAQVAAVIEQIRAAGLKEHVSRGAELVIIGAIGDEDRLSSARFERLPGVERVSRVTKQYKMVSRDTHPVGTSFKIRGALIGGEQIQVFAGVRSLDAALPVNSVTSMVQAAACRLLWAGSESLNQNPYEFNGFEAEKLIELRAAARSHALPFAAELNDFSVLETSLANDVDALILGARSMQNRALLRELGRINKPVILRRGLAASLSEWLLAAETIAAGGNHHIILCEQATKNGLDIATIPFLKRETHLPVFVDASNGAKVWMVPALAQAAIAAGADGLMLDIHPNPAEAPHGGDQALDLAQLQQLMTALAVIAPALGRRI
ncbi:3-deoxy-7-phosphoheptulonate synthase [Deefgea rivuli]|uniref:3-deoxy-7-phosphoheptulonate synthase n=1 Tax=Deefgea rivuli TaxID=400948 RepID=UPI0004848252|nr:3-deoxy-7-phosphoheptulonate synthase [Deefgea rivuli]